MNVIQNIKLLSALRAFKKSIKGDNTIMKWLMSLIALAGSAATIFAPQIQSAVSTHPSVSASIAALVVILAHIAPSPTGAALVTETGETGKATAVAK